jgi:hypothetical protein
MRDWSETCARDFAIGFRDCVRHSHRCIIEHCLLLAMQLRCAADAGTWHRRRCMHVPGVHAVSESQAKACKALAEPRGEHLQLQLVVTRRVRVPLRGHEQLEEEEVCSRTTSCC